MWDNLSRKQGEMETWAWGGSGVERLSDSPTETSRVESPKRGLPGQFND